jgi:carbonic anhydrase
MPQFIQELVRGFEQYTLEEGGPNGSIQTLYEHGQKPKYLILACADSRVHPEKICNLHNGQDFDMRLGGPFLPAYDANSDLSGLYNDHFELFLGRGISEIAIFAHEDCAAAGGVAQTPEKPVNTLQKLGVPFLKAAQHAITDNNPASLHRAVEQQVAIKGLEHLLTYPCVQNAVDEGRIHVHGLMYVMSTQSLLKYSPEKGVFLTIAGNNETPNQPIAFLPV